MADASKVSSRTSYRRVGRDPEDPEADMSESTTLLGSGADNDSNTGDAAGAARKGSWSGSEDFEGLPWWKRPSVSFGTR